MKPIRHILPLRDGPETRSRHDVVVYDWGNPEASNFTVCVHGLTRNAHDFDIIAPALAATGRRVLAINMPGRGESAWLREPAGYNYATYVADAMAIMDNFHLRNVEWIGTSMGGIIGMMIAAQPKSRIKKLVLNDIGTYISSTALQRIYGYVSTMPARFESRPKAEAYLLQTYKTFGITNPAHWAHFVDSSLLPDTDGSLRLACDPAIAEPIRAASENFTKIDPIDLSEMWTQIDIPTLIIRGSESDVLEANNIHTMRLGHIKAQSIVIQGVGHAPSLMEADQIEIVKRWLIEGRAGNVTGMANATVTTWI